MSKENGVATLIWLPVAVCGMLAGGCNSRPGRVEPPQIDPAAAAAQALADFDSDGDGTLDAEELIPCPGLKAASAAVAADRDGKLSAAEITARIKQWSAGWIALVAVNCRVSRHGRPLPGATVTLVPEKFLGSEIKPAAGVSDSTGRVELAVRDALARFGELRFFSRGDLLEARRPGNDPCQLQS